jgi:hypothetical protein
MRNVIEEGSIRDVLPSSILTRKRIDAASYLAFYSMHHLRKFRSIMFTAQERIHQYRAHIVPMDQGKIQGILSSDGIGVMK